MAKTSKAPKKRLAKTTFSSIYGSVRVYTRRHINGCELGDPNDQRCSCPKWIYAKPRDGRAVQKAAKSPSFTEACADAQRILKGFDPEIRAAREITEPVPGITIEACLEAYRSALDRRSLSTKYVSNCLMPFKRRMPCEYANGRAKNLSLLDFLDHFNLTARDPVVRMEQLTSDLLDRWAAGWKTNDSSTHTWRGVVTTFVRWAKLHDHIERQPVFRERHRVKAGNRCGYFNDEQFAKLCEMVPFYHVPSPHKKPENYAARLRAFLDLGRWGGMALLDIVNFAPKMHLGKNDVLTYRRGKNGMIACVALDPSVAARLRSIPPEAGSDPDKPLRFIGSPIDGNKQLWRARFENLCKFAGITEIETELGPTKPHPHALRDTCAISAITHGVSLENVAKMLGHSSIAMTQKSYLFWVAKRVDHCIDDQRQALSRRSQAAAAEKQEQGAPTLIH
jgi:integrase